ncbi:MAG: MBOAT family O-acyltransferase, partial [Bacteroidota bacterium]|nr:MBOAT family O-acyltransferase [Bacteroidota bacterium]
ILWGLFKKMVIADNCAVIVNDVFPSYADYPGGTLLLVVVFFGFQIYGDFSGYSDIAIGTARLFGFNIMRNFAFPYFSRDIAEFWRRWHISLSSWFRDYVYIPLGGSRGTVWISIRNTFIVFIVSGFWHGANWTFIIWGALNAIYFLPLMLLKRNRKNIEIVAKGRRLPPFRDVILILGNFGLVSLAWVFFRAENLSQALGYLQRIFSGSLVQFSQIHSEKNGVMVLLLIVVLVITEWIGRENQHALEFVHSRKSRVSRWIIYVVLVFAILSLGGSQQEFIYFQF